MSADARIDVLLACYNGEAYLSAQLESLRQQQDVHLRILAQDDGSSDGTPALLAQAARTGSVILGRTQGAHLGAVANFWSLLSQSDAPYIAFCDQDDVWHPDRLKTCLSVMRKAETEYGAAVPLLVHSDSRVIDAEGNVLRESLFRHQGWDPAAVTFPRLLVQNNVTGCTVLLNRALADAALRFGDPEKMRMHDWYLALTAAAYGHVILIGRPLVDYRQHGRNVQGASRGTLVSRAAAALRLREKGKARIALTYTHTKMFLDANGGSLPAPARETAEKYLAAEKLPKLRRLLAVRRLGCTMQSPVTRAGQLFFG